VSIECFGKALLEASGPIKTENGRLLGRPRTTRFLKPQILATEYSLRTGRGSPRPSAGGPGRASCTGARSRRTPALPIFPEGISSVHFSTLAQRQVDKASGCRQLLRNESPFGIFLFFAPERG